MIWWSAVAWWRLCSEPGRAVQEIQAAVVDEVRSHLPDHAIHDDITLVVLKGRV
ncbi:hypothetical protein ACQ4N7_21510 [Nodosilinea sp. AN01ver1]|uniref:hypothetical protein n=1 Tax=Nodosilinea sp. AN01ver1 TaxID=3423362 RepID=UPI003D315D35